MTERWLPIDGHPSYEVSDLGRVRSLDRAVTQVGVWGVPVVRKLRGRILKVCRCSNGYRAVVLAGHSCRVHRLVAKAFVAGDTTLDVNHKDGLRWNNHHLNLEWVSRSENILHSYHHLPRKKHGKAAPVFVGGVVYESILAAARAIGVAPGSVGSALTNGHLCKGMEVRRGLPR